MNDAAPRAQDAPARRAPAAASPAPACTLVILGARGDLTERLLIPAIYNLASQGLLDDGFRMIGAGPQSRRLARLVGAGAGRLHAELHA